MQQSVRLPVIASGGVTTADDVARLAAAGLAGCIIGRALYEGKLTLAEALHAAAPGAYRVKGNSRPWPSTRSTDIRNIALCGHGSSGKTTLVDKMLNLTGAVTRPASVDDGTSVCDFDEDEKAHKYSIESAVTHFEHAGKRFNVIDTPGYPDFIGQAIGAFQAVETAAIVDQRPLGHRGEHAPRVSRGGQGGLRADHRHQQDGFREYRLSRACSTRSKRCSARPAFRSTCRSARGTISRASPARSTFPAARPARSSIRPRSIERSIESIVEVDEEVMSRYFEGTLPTDEELPRLIDEAIAQGTLIPIVCVAGKTGVGLEGAARCLGPLRPAAGRSRAEGDRRGGQGSADQGRSGRRRSCAQVFKTRIDPFVQKLSYIRVFSGTLKKDDSVHVSGGRKNIKIGPLLEVQGSEIAPDRRGRPGEIVALAKIEDLHTGTTLGDFTMPPPKFPTPMVGLAVTPKSRGDEAKLSGALHKMVEEDPTFRIDRDPQTKELVMTGMSELHLMVVREQLKKRDKVEIDTKEPKIPYRETIQNKAEGSYRHKKQTGGRGQFGEVHIRMFPFPSGTDPEKFCTKDRFPSMRTFHFDPKYNFLWVDSIVGGTIPNNFLPAVEKGFKERLERGVIAGYQVQDVGVEVHFGKYHDVDSSEAAFKTAGSMAFRNVFQEARPSLLEPIVNLHITVPDEKLGDITSDLSGRRGRVAGHGIGRRRPANRHRRRSRWPK